MFSKLLALTFFIGGLFTATGFAAPPTNDNQANAQVIAGATGTFNGTTFDATREAAESAHDFNRTVYRTVWFLWTAPESKPVSFRVSSTTGFDAALAAQPVAPLEDGTRNNNTNGNLPRIEFEAIAGVQYRIVVGLFNDANAQGGNFTLEWAQSGAPTNDNFAAALNLEQLTEGSVAVSTQNATNETGEPVHIGNTSKSVWLKITNSTATDVSLTFSTGQSVYHLLDTTLSVYTGNTLAALTPVVKGDNLPAGNPRSRVTFLAKAGVTYRIAVDLRTPATSNNVIVKWETSRVSNSTDFATRMGSTAEIYYDNATDITVFRPSNGTWYWLDSSNNAFRSAQFGANGDTPVPADYDGDGRSDLAVTRNAGGSKIWYISNSFDNSFRGVQWGLADDKAMPGDYDFDGRMDIAVYRPSNGFWYVLRSKDNQLMAIQFGATGDIPVSGDFKGTTSGADFAVFRPSNGTWYVTDGTNFIAFQFGQQGDKPVPAQYEIFDDKTDFAVYRPSSGAWYYLRSVDNSFGAVQWGASSDIPQPGNYNSNANEPADFAVFRPSNNTWYILKTALTQTQFVQFGAPGDILASSASQLSQ